ncbi:MAG: DUF3822 family protein [Flavobacteriales bacterium]
METGNRTTPYQIYSHALVNQINLEHCVLSIRLLSDGLSLLIHHDKDKKVLFALQLNTFGEKNIIESLHDVWKNQNILHNTFKATQVYVQTPYSVWVPSSYFNPKKLEDVVGLQMHFESEFQKLSYDFHFKWNAYHVFAINKNVVEFFGKNVQSSIVYQNDLIHFLNRSKKVKSIQNKVFLATDKQIVDLWMIGSSRLIFHKTILQSESDEELAFRIMSALEVAEFDFVDDLFYCLNQLPERLYSILFKYIKSIQSFSDDQSSDINLKDLKKIGDYESFRRLIN